MKDSEAEARRWLSQAANDLQFAKVALKEGFFAQCCFISQQTAEKSLKAVHYANGERIVIGHSVFQLMKKLQQVQTETILEIAKTLDQYYIATRYPNGIPEIAPFEAFTRKQAEEAVAGAEFIFNWASALIL